jgi:hypothetical protein
MRSLQRPLSTSPESNPFVGSRESANPVGRSCLIPFLPKVVTGEDGNTTVFPDGNPTRPEKSDSLLIGEAGFSEKGTTPESGGGNRNLAGTAA